MLFFFLVISANYVSSLASDSSESSTNSVLPDLIQTKPLFTMPTQSLATFNKNLDPSQYWSLLPGLQVVIDDSNSVENMRSTYLMIESSSGCEPHLSLFYKGSLYQKQWSGYKVRKISEFKNKKKITGPSILYRIEFHLMNPSITKAKSEQSPETGNLYYNVGPDTEVILVLPSDEATAAASCEYFLGNVNRQELAKHAPPPGSVRPIAKYTDWPSVPIVIAYIPPLQMDQFEQYLTLWYRPVPELGWMHSGRDIDKSYDTQLIQKKLTDMRMVIFALELFMFQDISLDGITNHLVDEFKQFLLWAREPLKINKRTGLTSASVIRICRALKRSRDATRLVKVYKLKN